MVGRPKNTVMLTDTDRAALLSWSHSRNCPRALAERAQIVLACEQEPTNTAVAARLGVSRYTVGKWRSRFLADGLAGLNERPRSGRPPVICDDTIAQILVRTLTPPANGRAWSTRSMATEIGLSQTTVSRIWRAHRLQAWSDRSLLRPDGQTALVSAEIRDIAGLFIAPPLRVLAVAVDGHATFLPQRETTPATPALPADRGSTEARNILAAANAFALLRSKSTAYDQSRTHAALRTFLADLNRNVAASLEVHLLVDSQSNIAVPEAIEDWVGRYPRFRQDHVPTVSSWIDEVEVLLVSNPLHDHENMPGFASALAGLRDDIRAWCSTWAPQTSPFSWVNRTSSVRNDNFGRWERNKNSGASRPNSKGHDFTGETTGSSSGAPRITDRIVQLVREALAAGQFHHGQRVKEAPLAARLGVSRGPVREALRVLTEEGMLERLPNRGAVVPRVNTTTILDLYAARAMLGAVLMRRVAMLRRSELKSVDAALDDVSAVAQRNEHTRIADADLRFQDAIAQAANLPQTGLMFQRLTMRLRMFISILHLDYGTAAVDLIARENAGIFEAIRNGDGDDAARRWRVKVERSVRYMVAQLPEDHFDADLWGAIAGKANPEPGDPRKSSVSAKTRNDTEMSTQRHSTP
jgi:DNA-binding GntR family transcriptional regulator/transposase